MGQRVTVVAEMAEGACLVEHVEGFAAFVDVVLGFRKDPDCVRLTWHATPDLAAEELREAGCWPVRPLPAEVA